MSSDKPTDAEISAAFNRFLARGIPYDPLMANAELSAEEANQYDRDKTAQAKGEPDPEDWGAEPTETTE